CASCLANAGDVVVGRITLDETADIDIPTEHDIRAGGITESRVVVAGSVAKERLGSDAYVVQAACQFSECLISKRVINVSAAGAGTADGTGKRLETDRGTVTTLGSVGPDQEPSGQAAKSEITNSGVAAGVNVAAQRVGPNGRVRPTLLRLRKAPLNAPPMVLLASA